jgi:hypothetical protein
MPERSEQHSAVPNASQRECAIASVEAAFRQPELSRLLAWFATGR